jgi:hypothetical protein
MLFLNMVCLTVATQKVVRRDARRCRQSGGRRRRNGGGAGATTHGMQSEFWGGVTPAVAEDVLGLGHRLSACEVIFRVRWKRPGRRRPE